jgi:hypothetical protein
VISSAGYNRSRQDLTAIRFAGLVGAELRGFTRPRGYDGD